MLHRCDTKITLSFGRQMTGKNAAYTVNVDSNYKSITTIS